MKKDMRRRERGQALIEMAIALPMLIILLLGLIEVGRYADLAIVVASSARAGAIYGAQNPVTAIDNSGIALAAQNDSGLGQYDSQTGTGLHVTPVSGLLAADQFCNGTSGSSQQAGAVSYIVVRTSYTAKSIFSTKQMTFNGCAQMQVAQ
jgi:Flp pilus assembly protein TadG